MKREQSFLFSILMFWWGRMKEVRLQLGWYRGEALRPYTGWKGFFMREIYFSPPSECNQYLKEVASYVKH
jgi:hypothetical protein